MYIYYIFFFKKKMNKRKLKSINIIYINNNIILCKTLMLSREFIKVWTVHN